MNTHLPPSSETGSGALIPDLGGEVVEPLTLLDGLLTDLQAWHDDPPAGRFLLELPGFLAACPTLLSVRRLIYLLRPTQCLSACSDPIRSPDGRVRHTVLTPVRLPRADVGTLSRVARVLGHPALPTPIRDLLTVYASVSRPDDALGDPRELVAGLAGLAGVLDLPATPATRLVAARLLLARRRAEPTLLTAAEEVAYQTTIDRINVLWTASSPAHRPLR
jgi:hypothetical protein